MVERGSFRLEVPTTVEAMRVDRPEPVPEGVALTSKEEFVIHQQALSDGVQTGREIE